VFEAFFLLLYFPPVSLSYATRLRVLVVCIGCHCNHICIYVCACVCVCVCVRARIRACMLAREHNGWLTASEYNGITLGEEKCNSTCEMWRGCCMEFFYVPLL
jgi:hypothetical protein